MHFPLRAKLLWKRGHEAAARALEPEARRMASEHVRPARVRNVQLGPTDPGRALPPACKLDILSDVGAVQATQVVVGAQLDPQTVVPTLSGVLKPLARGETADIALITGPERVQGVTTSFRFLWSEDA